MIIDIPICKHVLPPLNLLNACISYGLCSVITVTACGMYACIDFSDREHIRRTLPYNIIYSGTCLKTTSAVHYAILAYRDCTSVQRPLFSGPYVVVIGRFHCSLFTRYPNRGDSNATLSGAREIMTPTTEGDAPLSNAYIITIQLLS